jgi:hypothetical protein
MMVKPVDLTGETYGQLTVTEQGPTDANGKAQWYCACSCGRLKLIRALNLRQGRTRSCGECGAAHGSGIDPDAMRYNITVWTGPASPSGKPFCFAEVRDAATNELVFRSSPPVNRVVTKGEVHAGATRCMIALAQAGHIAPLNMRTYKRWAVEERVNIDIRACATEEATTAKWYEVTGIEPPQREAGTHGQGARAPTEIYVHPDSLLGFGALLEQWDDPRGAAQARADAETMQSHPEHGKRG